MSLRGNQRLNFDNLIRYSDRKLDVEMHDCSVTLAQVESQIESDTIELSAISEQEREADKQESETSLHERDIQDNLKSRQLTDEQGVVKERLKVLHENLLKFDQTSIKAKLEEYQAAYESLVGEVCYLHSVIILIHKRAGLVGELKQLEVQHKSQVNELNTDYKTVELDYDTLHKTLTTQTFSNQDLEKYIKALDKYF